MAIARIDDRCVAKPDQKMFWTLQGSLFASIVQVVVITVGYRLVGDCPSMHDASALAAGLALLALLALLAVSIIEVTHRHLQPGLSVGAPQLRSDGYGIGVGGWATSWRSSARSSSC